MKDYKTDKEENERECPPEYNKEKYFNKMSDANKKQNILRFNFDCQICGRRYYDYQDCLNHMRNYHKEIFNKYKSPSEYKNAVKKGLEPDKNPILSEDGRNG